MQVLSVILAFLLTVIGAGGEVLVNTNECVDEHIRVECIEALSDGIVYLESVQSPPLGEKGEFATYWWLLPDKSDKEHVFTTILTAWVLHSLNTLEGIPIDATQTDAFKSMKSWTADLLIRHMESKDGYIGVWRMFGIPGTHPELPRIFREEIPPDIDTTSLALAALLGHDPDISTMISSGLTGYFLRYRFPSEALFRTWMDSRLIVIDAITPDAPITANVLFFYATIGKEAKIQSTMTLLKTQIYRMIAGKTYYATWYPSPYTFTYFATRAYADGGAEGFLDTALREDLRNFILSKQESDGSWGTETALALTSLLNLGFNELTPSERDAVKKGITYLLEAKRGDGSWTCPDSDTYRFGKGLQGLLPLLPEGIQAMIKAGNIRGSDELTTAITLEAIGKYYMAS